MPTIAKNTFYLTLASVGQKLFSFIYFSILARAIGVEKIGLYVTALSFSTLFSVAADLGLTQVLIREGAKDKEKIGQLLGSTLILKLGLAVLAYAALNAVANLKPNPATNLIFISGVLMVLDSFTLSFYGALRALQNLRFEAAGIIVGQILIIAGGLLALLFKPTVSWFLLALGVGSLFNLLWSASAALKKGIKPSFIFDKILIKRFAIMAAPFALAGIFTKIYSYIDSVLLSYLMGAKEVGYYSIPNKVAFAFQFIPMAFAAALYPAMSNFFASDKTRLKIIFEKGFFYLALLAVPLSLGAFVIADLFVVKVYGAAYAPSVLPFKIIVLSVIFAFLDFPIGSLLNACRRQTAQTAAMGATMVLNILLNLFLIPRLGVTGAAIAAALSNAALFFIGFCFVPKIISLPSGFFWWKILKIIATGLVMALAVKYGALLLPRVLSPVGFVKTLIFLSLLIIFGGSFYFLLLWITRVIRKEELKDFLAVFKKS
ncbi:MAG: flippase [Candidatus Magasanikbacteria bacterium]|nr:flippase [Candidatus Magasanikbacteria bacterium]